MGAGGFEVAMEGISSNISKSASEAHWVTLPADLKDTDKTSLFSSQPLQWKGSCSMMQHASELHGSSISQNGFPLLIN